MGGGQLAGHRDPCLGVPFTVCKITGAGDTWVTEYLLTYDGTPTYTVSIMPFTRDHVTRETQYFADPLDAPAWRSRWVEQRDSGQPSG